MKQTASAAMKAVIWLRVRQEAQTPTPAMPAASSIDPTYWATIGPHCRSAPAARAKGIGRVKSSATQRNRTVPRYFPSSSSSSVRGWERITSSRPVLVSSARLRIATAGTKNR